MRDRQNKDHWYDGWFYDRFVAPNQDLLFRLVKHQISAGSTVLDVGCGTGRLSFALSDSCSAIMGIDLSRRNIDRAQARLSRDPHPNITFAHSSLDDLRRGTTLHFDYAVLTYVLHEVPASERPALLDNLGTAADRVLIGDYRVPLPGGVWTLLDHAVERLAGKEHFAGFRSFVENGGIAGEVARTRLTVAEEVRHAPRTSQLVEVRSVPPP
jgi:SAM-dependent methyltransferase